MAPRGLERGDQLWGPRSKMDQNERGQLENAKRPIRFGQVSIPPTTMEADDRRVLAVYSLARPKEWSEWWDLAKRFEVSSIVQGSLRFRFGHHILPI